MIEDTDLLAVDYSKTTFAEVLKTLRKKSGMTLRDLAKQADTSSSYLSQLETGKRNPPKPDMLKRISLALQRGASTPGLGPIIYSTLAGQAGYIPDDTMEDFIVSSATQVGADFVDHYATTDIGSAVITALEKILSGYDADLVSDFEEIILSMTPEGVSKEFKKDKYNDDMKLYYLLMEMNNRARVHKRVDKIFDERDKTIRKAYGLDYDFIE